MSNLANFALFQVAWTVAVLGAARGSLWAGPAAAVAVVAVHLALLVPAGGHRRELGFVLAVGLGGTLLDSALAAGGLLTYPGTAAAWSSVMVPPWIVALWVLFATLPGHSLRWLAGRPRLAVLLGAVGGPLAFLGGVRLGAVAPGPSPAWTWVALAVEYAVVTPLLLRAATTPSAVRRSTVGAT